MRRPGPWASLVKANTSMGEALREPRLVGGRVGAAVPPKPAPASLPRKGVSWEGLRKHGRWARGFRRGRPTPRSRRGLQPLHSSSSCSVRPQDAGPGRLHSREDTPSTAAFPGERASSTMLFRTRGTGGQGPKAEQHAVALLPVRAGGWAVKARQGHTTQVSRKL